MKVKDSKKVLNYQRANFIRMRKILEDTDWSELLSESDIDKSWEAFTKK